MTITHGMDAAGVESLAKTFMSAAERIKAIQVEVDHLATQVPWGGRDAEQFQVQWRTHRQVLFSVADSVANTGSFIIRQRADQLDASGLAGIGGSSGAIAAGLVAGAGHGADYFRSLGWKEGNAAWNAMSDEERAAFVKAHLNDGNDDSLPPDVRYAINKQRIEDESARLRGRQAELEEKLRTARRTRGGVEGGAKIRAELDEIKGRLNTYDRLLNETGNPPHSKQVLFFDPAGDGRIGVVEGDLAGAKNIAIKVPGVGNDMGSFGNPMGEGERLAAQINRSDTAVVTWLGYDTPDNAAVGAEEASAVAGAKDLVSFVKKIDSSVPNSHITVIGHSYGSTVTGLAAAEGMPADSIVMIGSPGAGLSVLNAAQFAHDGVRPDVHVGLNRWDEIKASDGRSITDDMLTHGLSPDHPLFGANEVKHFGAGRHSGYYNGGSEQIRWMADIVTRPSSGGGGGGGGW